MKQSNESSVANGGGADGQTAPFLPYAFVEACSFVKIYPGEVEFSHKSCVVHVVEEGVYVCCYAYSCKLKKKN